MSPSSRGEGATRREVMAAAGATCLAAAFSPTRALARTAGHRNLVVDYQRCTGCRTCEAACAGANVPGHGPEPDGLAPPARSNVQVHGYVPEVQVPTACSLCEDAPCVAACPIPEQDGRKALYRREDGVVVSDPARCVRCGSCARACEAERRGVIRMTATGPEGFCVLCGACVAACPYRALSIEPGDHEFRGVPPDRIAAELTLRWYGG